LISASVGQNDYLLEHAVLYRQHGKNIVGATLNASPRLIVSNLLHLRRLKQINREYSIAAQRQAMSLAARHKKLLNSRDLEKISTYGNLSAQNYFMKRFYTVKYGFWWSGTSSSTALFFIL
jgi:hypothetical protein